jgi:hypothetical protein
MKLRRRLTMILRRHRETSKVHVKLDRDFPSL